MRGDLLLQCNGRYVQSLEGCDVSRMSDSCKDMCDEVLRHIGPHNQREGGVR